MHRVQVMVYINDCWGEPTALFLSSPYLGLHRVVCHKTDPNDLYPRDSSINFISRMFFARSSHDVFVTHGQPLLYDVRRVCPENVP